MSTTMTSGQIPYLSVIGASYTGSTLFAFLLNAHPQIFSMAQMWSGRSSSLNGGGQYRCSCGMQLRHCPFFSELERRADSLGAGHLANWETHYRVSEYRWLDIFLARPLRNAFLEKVRDKMVPCWPGYRETVNNTSHRIVHVARASLEISGKEVFADTRKDAMRIRFLRDIEELDLKVIHLVRDVRGAVVSIIKHTQRGRTPDVARAIRIWENANMNADRVKRYISPRQFLRLRYDQLCDDPQGTMDSIADFVGVRHATIPDDFYKTEHHIIGNAMRLKEGQGRVRQDNSWRDKLTHHELATIEQIGGAANRYFGHDWP